MIRNISEDIWHGSIKDKNLEFRISCSFNKFCQHNQDKSLDKIPNPKNIEIPIILN